MNKLSLWIYGALGLLALASLSFAGNRAQSPVVGTMTQTKTRPTSLRARRAAQARRRRAEDRADYAAAVKACQLLDAGKAKLLDPETVWRDLGL